METQKIVKRIELQTTDGKVYSYEVPSVKAIDSPSPSLYRIVFDENQIELFYAEHIVKVKMWLKDVPKLVLPSEEEAVKVAKTKTNKLEK